jgi:hypothetical protein
MIKMKRMSEKSAEPSGGSKKMRQVYDIEKSGQELSLLEAKVRHLIMTSLFLCIL